MTFFGFIFEKSHHNFISLGFADPFNADQIFFRSVSQRFDRVKAGLFQFLDIGGAYSVSLQSRCTTKLKQNTDCLVQFYLEFVDQQGTPCIQGFHDIFFRFRHYTLCHCHVEMLDVRSINWQIIWLLGKRDFCIRPVKLLTYWFGRIFRVYLLHSSVN